MKSSEQEIRLARELVQKVEAEIGEKVKMGKRVHIIWDFDGVLASLLSDDVFELIQYDLEKYFAYEARLSLSPPRPGPWLALARKVGDLHSSQDIVTARSSFLAFRIMVFCTWHCRSKLSNWMRWILFIGHQSKAESFRIILESLKNDPDFFVYYIDDNSKHVFSFLEVSKNLEMSERTSGIVSPKIRDYTEEQLKLHYDYVMKVDGDVPDLVPGTPGGYANGFLTLPDGFGGFRNIIINNFYEAEKKAAIEKFGPILEGTFKDLFPDKPVTPDGLHFAFRYLREEAMHDTAMINEIMETAEYLKQQEIRDKK